MNYEIMGLVDDDQSKLHQSISGVSVIGTTEDIPRLVKDLGSNFSNILIRHRDLP